MRRKKSKQKKDITNTGNAQIRHLERLAFLGQMTAEVVHELNNPLTVLTVYMNDLLTNLLDDQSQNSRLHMNIQKMEKATKKIQVLVNSLTTLARPVDPHRMEKININDIVRDAVEFCSYAFRVPFVCVETDLAANCPYVSAVPNHLSQVVINLLLNAAQALKEEGGRILIQTVVKDPNHVQLIVSDNGMGISAEQIQHVFEPFYTTKPNGLGLGLSIVKQILDDMGCQISVESQPSKMTSFIVGFFKQDTRKG